jgi:hypothetical protein
MNCTNAGMCQCGAFEYHDLATLTCKPQRSFNQSCSVDFNCRVDKYLGCYNGYCTCIPLYPTWSYGFDKCIISASYNELCYSTTDCRNSSNLVCNDGTYTCICPTKTLKGKCDCIRAVGNEYYWDLASNCKVAKSYNQTCTGIGFDYMCKTMTEGTYCSNTGICSCKQGYYFNFASSICQSQLLVNKICTQNDACRSDLKLTCQFGVCLCNEATQFWLSDKFGCINYYSYNEGSCSSNSQCKPGTSLKCRTLGSTSCSCPTGTSVGKCDCPARTDNNEYYWNSVKGTCVLAGYYGEACTLNYQCQNIKGFYCESSKCQCPANTANTVYIWQSHNGYCKPLSCSGKMRVESASYYCYTIVSGSCGSGYSVASNLGAGDVGFVSSMGNCGKFMFTNSNGLGFSEKNGSYTTHNTGHYGDHCMICRSLIG